MNFLKKSILFILLFLCFSLFAGCAHQSVLTSGENGEEGVKKYTIYGDADADGILSAADADAVLQLVVSQSLIDTNSPLFLALDVDYNGVLSSSDARTVFRASEGIAELGNGTPHEHKWGDWTVETEKSCVNIGIEKRYCSKDTTHYQTRYIEKTKHDTVLFEEDHKEGRVLYSAPFYRCSVCGKYFKDAVGETVLPGEETLVSLSGDQQEICDAFSESYLAQAVQAAVIRDGRVESVYSYGTAEKKAGREVNEDTKYRVASISKLVSVMVFFCLKQEGLVDENADISDYFGYTCRSPYYPDTVITPLMIMSHTASMVDVGPMYLSENTLSSKSFYIFGYEPGTTYSYSNSGFAVIQCICERVTGLDFDAIAKKYIFEPLGIDAAYIASGLKDTSNIGELSLLNISTMLSRQPRPLGTGLNFAQGNLYISAKDYAKIICLLLNDGVSADGTRILTTESVNTMETVCIEDSSYGVALGMRKQTNVFQNKTVYAHTGSSYGMYSTFLFCPDEKSGVVVLTSGCSPEKDETTQLYTACLNYIMALYPEN